MIVILGYPHALTGERLAGSSIDPGNPNRRAAVLVGTVPPATGGILHLPAALERHRDAGIVLYNRVSSYGQAGRGKVNLDAKTDPLVCEIKRERRVVAVIRAIEEGKLSTPRPKLVEAAAEAKRSAAILVAPDLSRFIRAASYSRTRNRNAWPTAAEFDRLHELTLNVPLATVLEPFLQEDARHSAATKRSGKAGRPCRIDDALALEVCSAIKMVEIGLDRHGYDCVSVAARK
jgi:hypothetical protein